MIFPKLSQSISSTLLEWQLNTKTSTSTSTSTSTPPSSTIITTRGDVVKTNPPRPRSPRRRQLTITVPEPLPFESYLGALKFVKKKKEPLPQTQSPFFKLPLELRQHIYSLVFSHAPKTHLYAQANSYSPRSYYSNTSSNSYWVHKTEEQKRRRRRTRALMAIALLQSCRQVYTEAIDLFYTKGTFKFKMPGDLRHLFRLRFPAHRLDSIRSIWIDIRFKISCCITCDGLEKVFSTHEWESGLEKSVKNLPRLRHLHVSFIRDHATGTAVCGELVEKFVFPALMRIEHIACYVLAMNFPVACPPAAPFRVKQVTPSTLRFH